jgi:8-amino-7-oxononanoate synthase
VSALKVLAHKLEELKAIGRYRSLTLPTGIDLSSNDYLGLSSHPALRRSAIEALEGGLEIGSAGSRLLRGHRAAHEALETFAAEYFGCARSLFFSSGFQANYALITTLIARHDEVLYDELCHASMREGLHAARCRTVRIAHNELSAFEEALQRPRAACTNRWILVESVYSMEGDAAPIGEFLALAEQYEAMLLVDEAHATGVLGACGRGATEGLGGSERLIALHTCGKALGVAGALVCASEQTIEYLINAARPFIYSTAPMPLQALLVKRALELVRDEPERRAGLSRIQSHAQQCLPGIDVPSHIVPIMIGADGAAVRIAQALQARGFDIRAIRPPTVPAGTARLRLSLRVGLSREDIETFSAALRPLLAPGVSA